MTIAVAAVAAAVLVGACADTEERESGPDAATTTSDLATEVRTELGALHRSTIREVPNLVALFYHHPDGWAVEDTTFDGGATWCRHAWYEWEVVDAVSDDQFTVRYVPTTESPSCVPLGQPLVLDVTSRSTREGRDVLVGVYEPGTLHVERTLCPGTIDDWQDVCGTSSGLGPPTATPVPTP